MLVLIRLYPKGSLSNMCKLVESEKRNLYWDDVTPLYAIRQEGKEYLSILLDVKNLEAIEKVFVKGLNAMASVRETRTIPIMSPIYFPLPDKHPKDLARYLMYLRVEPGKYDKVYNKIKNDLEASKNAFVVYLSYSFGDDDIIVTVLAEDRETALNFGKDMIGKIDGVLAYDMSKVVERISMIPEAKLKAHTDKFYYTVPAGQKGKMKNPEAYEKYLNERAPMNVIIRLFAKKNLAALWEDIEKHIPKLESKNFTPLYASQQETKDHITLISEAINFEVLRDLLVKDLPKFVDVRKTRTIPMMDPTYYLLPKEHPKDLERFLISLKVNPGEILDIESHITSLDFPKNVFMTYMTFTLGEDDILVSILTDNQKAAQKFAKDSFDKMIGVRSYEVSNQLKTKRLTTLKKWKQHQNRYLSSYDKQFSKDLDGSYDWTNDFDEYATMTGAFPRDLE
ncbi:MAG: hypothetical protein KKH41_02605 [Candidatus Thermoplasmatota archaeon]|nr:hypothetical protein [Euryarchaeota archaeon]MBU4031642.1 hypothetical protein [Candidatus Thermoplasmatota archaeon]MBU4070890.1 hypothetical protein [Candidatus Thermoplasmatota archaeon]MBU4144788.1 hypothetical protein [Candidatus Thermoplasmatota archaeon]MBU4591454.1 hypothetical protein [Candidatus Thermoplasmatota archaeon]